MKTYFAKFFPVEEDVKSGDYWSSTTELFHLVRNQEHADKINKRKLNYPHNSWYRKGKLFLCSRDTNLPLPYPISEKAIFVKENDEFDANHDVMPILKEGKISYWKIKGPCGHFH